MNNQNNILDSILKQYAIWEKLYFLNGYNLPQKSIFYSNLFMDKDILLFSIDKQIDSTYFGEQYEQFNWNFSAHCNSDFFKNTNFYLEEALKDISKEAPNTFEQEEMDDANNTEKERISTLISNQNFILSLYNDIALQLKPFNINETDLIALTSIILHDFEIQSKQKIKHISTVGSFINHKNPLSKWSTLVDIKLNSICYLNKPTTNSFSIN